MTDREGILFRGRYTSAGSILVLVSTILTLSAFAMSVNVIPPVITSAAPDFGISFETFGYLFSLQFFIFMAASFLGGQILKKTAVKPELLVSAGLAGLSLSFFIAPFLSRFRELSLWIILLGFSGGLVETFSSVIVSSYDSQGSGRFLSFSQVFYCVGAIAAPQIVAALFDREVNWKTIFLLFGFMELFSAVFFTVTMVTNMRSKGKELPVSEVRNNEGFSRSIAKNYLFYLLSFTIFFYVISESFLVFWLPVYLEKFYSLSPSSAARGMSYYWIGLIAGRIAVSVIPFRISLWNILFFSSLGMLLCSAVLSFNINPTLLIPMLITLGLFFGPLWSTIVSLGSTVGGHSQFVSGIIGAGALGASVSPLVSSYIIKNSGFRYFFPAVTLGITVLLLLILVFKITVHKKESFV